MIRLPDCAFQDGSYPCGYKVGGKLPDCELCHKIRKAGIREVMEELEGIFDSAKSEREVWLRVRKLTNNGKPKLARKKFEV